MLLLNDPLAAVFMPEKCYEELFIKFTMHVPCLLILMTHLAHFGVVMQVFFEPLPQLLKMLRNKNAEGLSLTYVLLQLYVLTCPIVFATANYYPFHAWGDRIFSLIPAAAILFLVPHYRGDSITGFKFLFGFGAWMTLLAFYAPLNLISWMYKTAWMVFALSKVIQIAANYRNGHTGQLSGYTMLLSCGGSLGILIITLQDSDGVHTCWPYILTTILSFIMLFQVVCSKDTTAVDPRVDMAVEPRRGRAVDPRGGRAVDLLEGTAVDQRGDTAVDPRSITAVVLRSATAEDTSRVTPDVLRSTPGVAYRRATSVDVRKD